MPNHVTNILYVKGKKEEVKNFFETVKSKDRLFDFQNILPMPSNTFRGDLSSEKEKECKERGIPDWYNRSIKNWGTKWNAYSIYTPKYKRDKRDNYIVFDTARTAPKGVREQLAITYEKTSLEFVVKYADECIGENCGIIQINNGKISIESKKGNNQWARRIKNKSKWNTIDCFETNV